MKITNAQLQRIIKEELEAVLDEKCQKGYKTHEKRKTKKMFGKTYRNCVKAEEGMELEEDQGNHRRNHKAKVLSNDGCSRWRISNRVRF